MNSLCVKSCTIYGRNLSKQATKNIENSIIHIITNDIAYLTPSDRILNFYIEGFVTTGGHLELVVNITPAFIKENKKENLKKYIRFNTTIKTENLIKDLTKELSWVLNYFGFTIMYVIKYFKIIEIKKLGKGYTLEYKK